MINMLPPALKQEIRYSRRNAILLKYVVLAILVLACSIGALLAGRYYLQNRIAEVNTDIATKQAEIGRQHTLATNATSISARVKAIESIQASQAHFSQLLSDLSQYMPQGTAIKSVGLTGDDTKPVTLTVSAVSYETAVAFRDQLAKLKRISAADIQEIQLTPADPGGAPNTAPYQVTVNLSFVKGAAK